MNVNDKDKNRNGNNLPKWLDFKFLVLLISIIFSSAVFYATTQSELAQHRQIFIEENQKWLTTVQQLKEHADRDEREREAIKVDINNKYKERLSFQQSILQTLGQIQGKLDFVIKDSKENK